MTSNAGVERLFEAHLIVADLDVSIAFIGIASRIGIIPSRAGISDVRGETSC